ncbi:5-oxoprolinase/urea amidolyase family protein [Sneathiella sp. P13V-1]|uniref:5-oxoprolinase subunit C family protein n=1 Tax=Sneathiella sp. P13V-1 TaxID=2697366 RepID=UPI00187B196F|nr:biotin-dependent carboxyltransferase family protein [Sneathiella sp. P13V-1]MBE7637199.1 5-oxoprolinase/urea amidolyase family protein [Sneathiella sp. P13V-1]
MTAHLEILHPGLLSSIQDKGRYGMASSGVPRSGAVDPVSLQIGNALVGNEPFTAAIEFRFMGPKVKAIGGPLRLGLAADTTATLIRKSDEDPIEIVAWRSVTLHDGDELHLHPLKGVATGYLSVEGGFNLPTVLGSQSTYARASLGGLNGSVLNEGDQLPLNQASVHGEDQIVKSPLTADNTPIHIIKGPQDDYFSEETLSRFANQTFAVTKDVDRMGIRLEGDAIAALPEKGHDLISDGSVPGTIQVPGSGQPIILFMDCQTIGGYPKIGTVIAADMHRLGQVLPNQSMQFEFVSLEQASELRLARYAQIEKCISSIDTYIEVGKINVKALYEENIIDGVVNAMDPGRITGQLEEEL